MTEIVADLCNNHNGSIANVKKMIDVCYLGGCDYVKFQKRDIDTLYKPEELDQPRQSPWGDAYEDYRRAVEFDFHEYDEIDKYCKTRIPWFASPWDKPSITFLSQFNVPYVKIASASLTDIPLLESVSILNIPVILSTGMSSWNMIDKAISVLGKHNIYAILHCIGTYPNKSEELNLRVIPEMKEKYPFCKIGFSNHHPGIIHMVSAVALGAEIIEFHMTLDRTWYGSDQSASIEPGGVQKLVKYIRETELALGSKDKYISSRESKSIERLRWHKL